MIEVRSKKYKYSFLSLGAGVQSTVMLLMSCHREIPMPDAVIFADTGWEPQGIYDHRDLEDLGQINLFENECEGMCGL